MIRGNSRALLEQFFRASLPFPSPSLVPLARLSVITSTASGDFSGLNLAFAAKSEELAASYDERTRDSRHNKLGNCHVECSARWFRKVAGELLFSSSSSTRSIDHRFGLR